MNVVVPRRDGLLERINACGSVFGPFLSFSRAQILFAEADQRAALSTMAGQVIKVSGLFRHQFLDDFHCLPSGTQRASGVAQFTLNPSLNAVCVGIEPPVFVSRFMSG